MKRSANGFSVVVVDNGEVGLCITVGRSKNTILDDAFDEFIVVWSTGVFKQAELMALGRHSIFAHFNYIFHKQKDELRNLFA